MHWLRKYRGSIEIPPVVYCELAVIAPVADACRALADAVPPGLIRLAVGIEATSDLVDDLHEALDAAEEG